MNGRRWAVVAGLALAMAPGCTQRCNPGRLFLTVTLPGDVASKTARLSVRLSVGDQVRVAAPVAWRGHAGSNSFDVDFASGYQAGQVVTASAVALDDGGAPVGYSEHGELTLASGCDALTLAVPAAPALRLVAGAPGGPGSADGVGANARFDTPVGLAVDATRLYVADRNNSTVRMIDLASATVSTLAGVAGAEGDAEGIGADARLSRPNDLALVGTTLYLSDEGRYLIRAIDLSTGAVSTIAGNEHQDYRDTLGRDAAFHDPYGLCADGGNLYVTDNDNHVVRKIALPSTKVSSLIDVASADLGTPLLIQDPNGIACGGGVFYVADGQNNAIRKVTATVDGRAMLDTESVTVPQLSSPHAVVRDGDSLYIADTASATVRQLPVAGGAPVVIAGSINSLGSSDGAATTSARFVMPQGLAVDANHDLYIADAGSNTIRKLTRATGMVSTLAGAAINVDYKNGPGARARFYHPIAAASDAAGTLYLADRDSGTVRKLVLAPGTLDATVTCLAGSSTHPGCSFELPLQGPTAIAVAADGTVYVADNGQVVAIHSDGTSAAIGGGSDGPLAVETYGLAIDAQGNVYVADGGHSSIRRIDHVTQTMTVWAGSNYGRSDGIGTAATFASPAGLVIDGNLLYVADLGGHTIRSVELGTAKVTTLYGDAVADPGSDDGIGTLARFRAPFGLALDGRGNLYVADSGSRQVRRINLASGMVTSWLGVAGVSGVAPGPLPAQLNIPEGLTVLPDGTVVIVDFDENVVLAVR